MTAAELLSELRRRGVSFTRHGDRLRYCPADRVTEAEVAALRAEKPELLRLLADTANPATAPGSAEEFTATLAPEGEPCAWRVFSRRVDRELWLCRDLAALADLQHDGFDGPPAMLVADVERLRTMNDTMLHRVFDALAVFPGARLADVVVKNAD